MAKQYVLTPKLQKITETAGTIYNAGRDNVELASSSDAKQGEGIPLLSGQKIPFAGTVYARAIDGAGTEAVINVVDFNQGGSSNQVNAAVTVQEKICVPSNEIQEIIPDSDKYLSKVIVLAVDEGNQIMPDGSTVEYMTAAEVDALF